MEQTKLEELYDNFTEECRALYLDAEVPVLDGPPDALAFYRQWVAPNKPVVFKNCIKNWPALGCWSHNYLRSKIGEQSVTVAVTPNGYADAVYEGKFLLPEERQMKFNTFLDILEKKHSCSGIFYVQKQNSNFTDEFECLMKDAASHLPWATEAFARMPDAVNFWMGDESAVTSMHKDHYENLYCVVNGEKTFTLIPPTDQLYVPYEKYQAARFLESASGQWDIMDEEDIGEVPWIPVDPINPDLVKYPSFAKAKPVTVTVHKGEMLYLPSLWYHHVQQSHACIAVNFWYDMDYDIKYSYYSFLESLASNS